MKNIFKPIIQHTKDFYVYAGSGLFVLFFINLFTGVVELLGIGLLLPVLNLGFGSSGDDRFSALFQSFFEMFGYNPTLERLLILLVFIFVVKAVAVFANKYFSNVIAINLKGRLQTALTDKLVHTSYMHFTGLKSGFLNNILMKETALFTQGFLEFVRIQTTFIYIMVYFLTATILRPDLTIILVLLSLIIFPPMRVLMRIVRTTSKNLTERSGSLSNGFTELIDNFIYAKATGAIQGFRVNIKDKIHSMNQTEKALFFFAAFIQSLAEPIAVIALVFLVYTQVVLGNSELSEVLVLGLLIHRIVGQIMLLQGQWQRFNSTFGSMEIVKNTLDQFIKNKEPDGHENLDKVTDIVFRDVSYAYKDKCVLDRINLIIPCNKMVGIIGPSGSGKTTLFYLLTGLLSEYSGDILVGDVDYKSLRKSSLRAHIGYVSQTPAMIDGTLLDNINFGTYDLSAQDLEASVVKALQQAGLEEFIGALDKPVGERGVQLSGGQRQRVAIARELLRNTDLLILDEATSALDIESDQKIQETLKNLKGQKTIVIISHKLTNIENCDIVYRLENGKLKTS